MRVADGPGAEVVAVLRVEGRQDTWWEVLPEQARHLPAELAGIDAFLDDERFIAPWRAVFAERLGRPSVPVETLLRLLYLKHRYQIGYETLCREVADSLSWRRFCRIPLTSSVPHPTTLVKLVRRSGTRTVEQLNAVLLGKLVEEKVVRCRKLRLDTTVIEADIDHPTDADLLEHGVRSMGRLAGRIKAVGAASRTRFRVRSRSAGRRLKQISRTLRRRTGQALGEIDRLTGEIAAIARATLQDAYTVERNARRTLRRRPSGQLTHLVGRSKPVGRSSRPLARSSAKSATAPRGLSVRVQAYGAGVGVRRSLLGRVRCMVTMGGVARG
jgi:transposase, IS5 family